MFMNKNALTFSELLLKLQQYWAEQGKGRFILLLNDVLKQNHKYPQRSTTYTPLHTLYISQ